jgi:PEP-CTERM motif
MRRISAYFLGAALALGATSGAHAALVRGLVFFSGAGFTSAFGNPVPVDPVIGSFFITFDPTQTYTDETSGITLNSLNIGLDSALSFDYSPTGNGNGAADELVVGGLEDGASSISLGSTGADFYLHIFTFSTDATYGQIGYSPNSGGEDNTSYFYTPALGDGLPAPGVVGSVTVFPAPPPSVPEPSTWAMLMLGFASLGFLAYRNRGTPAAA